MVIFSVDFSRPFLLTNNGFITPNHANAADIITLTDCLLVWWDRFLLGTSFLFLPLK